MASTLYDYLSNKNAQPQRTPVNGPMNMMQQFNEFSKTVNDPKAEVERLLANGQMTKNMGKG